MVADYVNYLHSNMFLLFLVLFTVTFPCVIRIYIPICFYYFAILSNFFIFRFKIYIPICFYYFCRSRSETFLPGIFTFQYVSIISKLDIELYTDDKDIYIPICFYYFNPSMKKQWNLIDLHSNMFLLFPKLMQHFIKLKQIYIPICFYYF